AGSEEVGGGHGGARLSGSGRRAPRDSLASPCSCSGGSADRGSVPGHLPWIQRAAFLSDGETRARGEAFVLVREAAAAVCGSDEEGTGSGAASDEASATAALRGDAAPGRKSSRLAGTGTGGETDSDPGGGRCDLAAAVRAVVAWRDDACGDDGDERSGTRARDSRVVLHRPGGVGV